MIMRSIKFRGKTGIDEIYKPDEWVYGDVLHNVDCVKIREQERDIRGIARSFVVNPRTVGQYTGLLDTNGKPIYEGDIVKLLNVFCGEIVFKAGAFGIGVRPAIDYDYLASEIAETTGHDNHPYFCYNNNFVSLWELYWNYNQENECCSVVEIIGNIHDNPELI